MKSLFIRILALLLGCFIAVAIISSLVFKWISHELDPHERHFTELSHIPAKEAVIKYEEGDFEEFSKNFRNQYNGKIWVFTNGNNLLAHHPLPEIISSQITQFPLTIYPHQNRAGRFFVFAHEISGENGIYKVIMTSRKPSFRKNPIWILWLPLAIVVVGFTVASILLSYWMLRPLRAIRQASQAISADNPSTQVPRTITDRKDAFGGLGREINQMADRVHQSINNQNQLLQDISHELRSPLARIQVATSLVVQKLGSNSETERIETEIQKLDSMIEELLSLSRLKNNTKIDVNTVNLVDLLSNTINDANFEFQQSNKFVEFRHHPDVEIQGNDELLTRMLENIIRNGLRYTAENEAVVIEISDNNSFITIDIMDNGPGVPEDAVERIFDPFYRADKSRTMTDGHHGIGLTIAKTIAELHGGKISAVNNPNGGLCVSVRLRT